LIPFRHLDDVKMSERGLVPTILRLASLAQDVEILKITTTHTKHSWVILEEAGIFTRHDLWRATTELRPQCYAILAWSVCFSVCSARMIMKE